jgi:hypothetical protein
VSLEPIAVGPAVRFAATGCNEQIQNGNDAQLRSWVGCDARRWRSQWPAVSRSERSADADPGAATGNAPPSFAELEAVQARIGEVRVRTEDVFDTENPKEASTLYRWANALHIQTRASVIENALLFKRGDPVSVAVIDETERLLRGERYLYDVRIRPVAYQTASSTSRW